ncbi:hypothetical protein PoB_002420500 [Plakobranchus ocellatus]|uniref:Uncharacterized protein n=1 Tax=Plakobranchus ocellatus TaxID=259542 RepID=A0AAV3ZPQ1_9GAST|nr:hypothetical protein PoB_002420500 [Plakobranchus ocellatus]
MEISQLREGAMEDSHVFKVPSQRKRRPSLYCRETLDGLDDIWTKPKNAATNNLETSTNTKESNLFRPNFNTSTRNIPESNSAFNGYDSKYANENSNKGDSKYSSHTKYLYAVGLLNEFSKHSTSSNQQNLCNESVSFKAKHVETCSNSNQHMSDNSNCPPQTAGHYYNSEDEDMSISPDVLITCDESLAGIDSASSGSDIDWESLTPPAPRSPGDHTVPDLYDLENITPPSDCLTCSYDYLASIQQTLPNGAEDRFGFSTAQHGGANNLSMATVDHIVPDFFI